METIHIGLLGCGTVGGGVVKILQENAPQIEARLGAHVRLARVAVQHPARERDVHLDPSLLTGDAAEVVDDPRISLVVELIGGIDPARGHILRAIENGKHIVTANKALLAHAGGEIFDAASRRCVDVYFEGAVGGGIPIIRSLRESLSADRLESIHAILNGTSNFILTEMDRERRPFEDALARARALAYAEADPSLDVDGIDAAQKLAILVSLAFGTPVPLQRVYAEGIRGLEPVDLENAAEFGYRVKLLAIARDRGDGIEARVHPTLIPRSWLLASVDGVMNAFYLQSYALGPLLFYGSGAGRMPTGSAVVADVIDLCRNTLLKTSGRVPHLAWTSRSERRIHDIGDVRCAHYLRFAVLDRPGVLARIAGILGDKGVSIRQMVQRGRRGATDTGSVDVVMLTHEARDASVRAAVEWIDSLDCAAAPTRVIRIEE